MEFENTTNETVFEPPVQTPFEGSVETPVEPAVTETPVEPAVTETPVEAPVEQAPTISLTEVEVTNSNIAFNVIVSFLTVAQKRGTFSINESAKIWECLKFFLTPEQLSGIKQ
jgi:hypothetical protein